MAPQKPRRGRQQVAALCWRRGKSVREILLITSRETRRWVIPKGWPMDHLKDFNAAKTEAYEEAGVLGRMSRTALGKYTYDKVKDTGTTRVTVSVYGLEVTELLTTWPEKGERQRKWFTVEQATEKVDEVGLKQIFRLYDKP
jgi:8-oxo-dGTP pyrophosphatase MutT (NUDIX family)